MELDSLVKATMNNPRLVRFFKSLLLSKINPDHPDMKNVLKPRNFLSEFDNDADDTHMDNAVDAVEESADGAVNAGKVDVTGRPRARTGFGLSVPGSANALDPRIRINHRKHALTRPRSRWPARCGHRA
jgi:hypothetical protein